MSKLGNMKREDAERVRKMQAHTERMPPKQPPRQQTHQGASTPTANHRRERESRMAELQAELPPGRAISDGDARGGRAGLLVPTVVDLNNNQGVVKNQFSGVTWAAANGARMTHSSSGVSYFNTKFVVIEQKGAPTSTDVRVVMDANQARAFAAWVQLHLKDEP